MDKGRVNKVGRESQFERNVYSEMEDGKLDM
jgi:hypothetical protein